MRVKVRHGLVRWREPRPDNRPGEVVRTGFRSMIVDIPADQARKHLDTGAVILPDDELKATGKMMPLPTNGSDEEFKAWVSVATDTEIEEACDEHPDLADRIREARAAYDDALAGQNEILGGSSDEEDDDDEGDEGDEEDFTDDDLDEVAAGSVTEVSEFLSEYPHTAARILEAEKRRAENDGNDVRKGIEQAVQVAAQHAAS